jgi:hypothetical protein
MRWMQRLALYTDLLTVTGIFVGFTGTALASYLAFSGARIEALRAAAGTKLTKQWLSVIRGPLLAIAFFVLAKIFDRAGSSPVWVRWLVEFGIIFTAWRIVRMLYIFGQLMDILVAPNVSKKVRAEPIKVRRRTEEDPPAA